MTSCHPHHDSAGIRRRITPALLLSLCLLAGSVPAGAQDLTPVRDVAAAQVTLSDGLGEGHGAWRSRSQVIVLPGAQSVERRLYEVFDPAPERDLDFTWQADDLRTDHPGRVSGSGRLIWRAKDAPVHSDAGIVAVYRGTMRDGRPEGEGLYATREGLIYQGQWEAGRPTGRGRLVLPGGEQYEGAFRAGYAEGAGVFTEPTWERFEGLFRRGRRTGVGRTILPSGLAYQSQWRNGRETLGSRRIRMAQLGATAPVGGTQDVRFRVTMKRNLRLPIGIEQKDVLRYAMQPGNGELLVVPDDARLVARWLDGAELTDTALSDEASPVRFGLFGIYQGYTQPAAFDIGFQNMSKSPVEIVAIEIASQDSRRELAPPLDLKSAFCSECNVSYNPTFSILNYGAAAAERARLRFAFTGPDGSRSREYVVELGDITELTTVDLTRPLQAAGVNTAALESVSTTGLHCNDSSAGACLAAARRLSAFGSLGSLLALRDNTAVLQVRGELDYGWIDAEQRRQHRTVKLAVPIGLANLYSLAEAGSDAPPDAVRARPVRLRIQPSAYVLSVPFRAAIPAGRTQNFSLELDAEASSWHRFRFTAVLSDGRRLLSPPIRLLYFSPSRMVTD